MLVEELTRQIMTKTLHNPITTLKKYQSSDEDEHVGKKSLREKTKIIEELFE
jgi:glutamyl-tRNA reductase